MGISPILLNATIQQTNQVLQNQNKETHKPMLDQGNIYVQEHKKEERLAREVVTFDKSEFFQERYDAKDKGHGHYQGDGGKKKKPLQEEKKDSKPHTGFDIKI